MLTRGPMSGAVARDVAAGGGEIVADDGTLFPLSRPYAVNRLVQSASGDTVIVAGRRAPTVPVTTPDGPARRLGRGAWAFDRRAFLAAGGVDHTLGPFAVTELGLRLRGHQVAAGLLRRAASREPAMSPLRHLRHLPGSASPRLRRAISDAEPLPPSHRAKTHYLYRLPGLGVLHLYVHPGLRLLNGTAEREVVRERAPLTRVPAVQEVVRGSDSLWLLEDEVAGPPLSGRAEQWWAPVSDWLVDLAGPPGPPLASTRLWTEHAAAALALLDGPERGRAATVLERAGRWASRHQHGDLQPKNVVQTAAGPAAVDWEGVWSQGLPGLDLLFLAVMADGAPDPAAVALLAAGQDLPGTPVLPAVRRWGLAEADLTVLASACLLLWSLGEARRVARLGAPAGPGGTTWAAWRDAALARP